MTAADKYYLKAKDNYPYCLDDALEALEYGLSHDDTHAGLLTLMGDIYHNDLKQFDAARECYELALYHDVSFVTVYYSYLRFLVGMEDYAKAEKLIARSLKVKGIDKAEIYYWHAQLYEKQNNFPLAIRSIKTAKGYCTSPKRLELYEEETKRIEKKHKYNTDCEKPIRVVLVE